MEELIKINPEELKKSMPEGATDVSRFVEDPEGSVEEVSQILNSQFSIRPEQVEQIHKMSEELHAIKGDSKKTSATEGIYMKEGESPRKDKENKDPLITLKETINNKEYLAEMKENKVILPEYALRLMNVESIAFYYNRTLEDVHEYLDKWLMGGEVEEVITYKAPSGSSLSLKIRIPDPRSKAEVDMAHNKIMEEVDLEENRILLENSIQQIKDIMYDVAEITKVEKAASGDFKTNSIKEYKEILRFLVGLKEPMLKRIVGDIAEKKVFYLILASHPAAYQSF